MLCFEICNYHGNTLPWQRNHTWSGIGLFVHFHAQTEHSDSCDSCDSLATGVRSHTSQAFRWVEADTVWLLVITQSRHKQYIMWHVQIQQIPWRHPLVMFNQTERPFSMMYTSYRKLQATSNQREMQNICPRTNLTSLSKHIPGIVTWS